MGHTSLSRYAFTIWTLLSFVVCLPLGFAGQPTETKAPVVVLMSASPWVGMEPEFKGAFKTGVQRLLTGDSPFGVYDPKIESAKKKLVKRIWALDAAERKSAKPLAFVQKIEEVANKYSAPEKGEVVTDYKVTFKLPDDSTFWMVVSADPATVEAQTMPVTFEEMRTKFQHILDRYLYQAGAAVGLEPRVELGSNHFHIGTATAFYKNEVVPVKILNAAGSVEEIVNIHRPIEENAGVFRDYLVSIFNNPALANFADDGYIFTNAPHPAWIAGQTEALRRVIYGFDHKPMSVQALAKKIQAVYTKYSPIDPDKHYPAKYTFFNVTRTADSPSDFAAKKLGSLKIPESFKSVDELAAFLKSSGLEAFYQQTTEARAIGGQTKLAHYMAIMELYFDRLEYIRKINLAGKGKIPLLIRESPYYASHSAYQLAYFVRETYEGLGLPPEAVKKKWKTLASLIRKSNVRDAALEIDPFEMSLKKLSSVAYEVGRKNFYRRSCSWLFQKSMNLLPDDK